MARLFRTLWLCLALALLAAPQGLAQTAPAAGTPVATAAPTAQPRDAEGIDYAAWESTASRAEEAIANGRASNRAMEQLRAELSEWRALFLEAQGTNAARIATVREQIEALGPKPAEGETEADEIATRRAELNAQLERLRAPVVKAEEAHSRADGMIGEIDGLIRARQADELLELGPTPLNPGHWVEGWSSLTGSLRAIWSELKSDWQNSMRQTAFRDSLPATLSFLLIGVVLLARGRMWMVRLTNWLYRDSGRHGRRVFAAVISFSQVILPYVGILAIIEALHSSDLLGLRLGRLVEVIPDFGLLILLSVWLAGRLLPRQSEARPVLEVAPEHAGATRLVIAGLGVALALTLPLAELADYDDYSPEALSTLRFPLLLAAGILLFRLGRVLLAQGGGEDDPRPYRNSIVRQIGRFVMAVGVAGPLLGLVGYTEAADFILFPTVASMGLAGAVALIQRFITDLYVLLIGSRDEEAREHLVPVLMSFAVVLAALPVLALIWGARLADLTELWARFTEGFTLGDTRISPSNFILFAVVFTLGYGATRLLQGALRNSVLPKTRIDPGGQTAIIAGTGYVGIVLAAILAITSAGIDLSSLAIVAGALSVGIGFGLQNIVSNFVSGIILLIERPVREGDWIEVGPTMGTVRNISVRSTRIETFDRTDVIVPNADLISGSVTNWTKNSLTGRLIVKVGVAYGTDTRLVERILAEIGEAHPLAIVNPPPMVVFQGFGADALEFELRVILRDVNFILNARTDLNHEIARRFAEEGIEIPFAQRDIWLRNPETLQRTTPAQPAQAPQAPAPGPAQPARPASASSALAPPGEEPGGEDAPD